MSQYIVVHGDETDAVSYGPFNSFEEATKWAEDNFTADGPFFIEEVLPPSMLRDTTA